MKRKLVLAAALAGVALPAIGLVQANAQGNTPISEVQMALAAPVKLDQAGQIALKAAPGTLAQIGFNDENGAGVYEASVVGTDGAVTIVRIDAQSGKVLGTTQATTLGGDHEHGEQADPGQNGDGEEQDG
ncbi:PepSY domain-containing protein [Acidimangrovimonas pyrenivorans]|uniref:PepSY domain-containing protein n=1 Tax=Acidimangrovimonas pyrenivorans TaxID=2030798 RepID=A0ABV7AFU3_9RHOB